MNGETRAVGAVVMGITAVLAVAFAIQLVAGYLVPVLTALSQFAR